MLLQIIDFFNKNIKNLKIYEKSFKGNKKAAYFLAKDNSKKFLCSYCENAAEAEDPVDFIEQIGSDIYPDNAGIIKIYNTNHANIEHLRKIFPELLPAPLSTKTSFGFGDRLGLATPGHIRVINDYKNILPVFAQQSVRELTKTKRSFESVLDDASWNVFQEGYSGKWGADADHIKEIVNFKAGIDAGFTMFTIDASEKLNENILNNKNNDYFNGSEIDKKFFNDFKNKYLNKKLAIDGYDFNFNEDNLTKIFLVYKDSLNYIYEVFKFIKGYIHGFDYEVSFDETNTVTMPEAHFIIANELIDNGIEFTSLAFRFPGTFEKGIDYIGNIEEFEKSIKIHGNLCKKIGGYKMSLHSGSDKLSIYPIFVKYTDNIFHIKTSGTSWLEALRVTAFYNPALFRNIYKLSADTFEENKKSYHMSLDKKDIPPTLKNIKIGLLPDVLNDRDLRRVLHIAYEKVLNSFKEELYSTLNIYEQTYFEFLKKLFYRHFESMKVV